jgi:DNA-binding NarL/FixJ family response regulator
MRGETRAGWRCITARHSAYIGDLDDMNQSRPVAAADASVAIRIILADDHAVVRAGLKAVLGTAKDITVIGEATTGQEAVDMATRLDADVVIMDLDMPTMDGIAATKALVDAESRTRVLVLTMHSEGEYLLPLLEAGASGYLMKSAADRELVDAVRAVARGETYVQPSAARTLARGITRRGDPPSERDRYERITERERDVLRLVASGYSAPEIGEQLFISPKTVDTYKQRISEKLGLTHRSDYVRFAMKLGLLKAD